MANKHTTPRNRRRTTTRPTRPTSTQPTAQTTAQTTEPRRRAEDATRQAIIDRITAAANTLAFGRYPDEVGMFEEWAKMLEHRIDWNREAHEHWNALSAEDRAAVSRVFRSSATVQ